MHTFKSLLLVAVLVASMCPAFAEDSCEALFAAVDTSRESTVSLEDSHPEIYQSIEEMKARLLKPASKIERVTRLTLAKRMNEITDLLTKFFVHSYSFSYVAEGIILKIRLWTKTGDKEIGNEIDFWLKRYSNYQMNRRLLVEKAFFVRNEAKILEALLGGGEVVFPVTVSVPRYVRRGLQSETRIYVSKVHIAKELKELKSSQKLYFGRNYSSGAFLKGRDLEQARLEAKLHTLHSELKNNAFAGNDLVLRAEKIRKIEELLADEANTAVPYAQYIEARRSLTDEIGYFTGKRELTFAAKRIVEERLLQNDVFDLGLDRERLSILNRLVRQTLVQAPTIILSALALVYTPVMKDAFKAHVLTPVVMQEIASLPQRQYEERSLQFLKDIYGVKVVDGQVVMSPKARKALEEMKKDRSKHLAQLREENISQATYDFILNADASTPKLSPEEFKELMELAPDKFPAFAKDVVTKVGGGQEMLARLVEAYERVHASPSKAEPHAKVGDKIFDSFAGFVLGAKNGEKEE